MYVFSSNIYYVVFGTNNNQFCIEADKHQKKQHKTLLLTPTKISNFYFKKNIVNK